MDSQRDGAVKSVLGTMPRTIVVTDLLHPALIRQNQENCAELWAWRQPGESLVESLKASSLKELWGEPGIHSLGDRCVVGHEAVLKFGEGGEPWEGLRLFLLAQRAEQ